MLLFSDARGNKTWRGKFFKQILHHVAGVTSFAPGIHILLVLD